MEIYFAGSIRGGREDANLYASIIDFLRQYGNVMTEHVGSPGTMPLGEEHLSDVQIHQRDFRWLQNADIVIAEVTVPSLGVGYEIGRAIELKKSVLCLFRPNHDKQLSAMIGGCPAVSIINYTSLPELTVQLALFFEEL